MSQRLFGRKGHIVREFCQRLVEAGDARKLRDQLLIHRCLLPVAAIMRSVRGKRKPEKKRGGAAIRHTALGGRA